MAHSLSAISGVEEKPLKAPFDSPCISVCVIVDARSLSECACPCACQFTNAYVHIREKSHTRGHSSCLAC